MDKGRLIIPMLLGAIFGAGNNHMRLALILAIGLMAIRGSVMTSYRIAKANRSIRSALDVFRAGKPERFAEIPKPSFPKASVPERIVYWIVAMSVAYALVTLKVDGIAQRIIFSSMLVAIAVSFVLVVNFKANVRRMKALAAAFQGELAQVQSDPPGPPRPSFGRAVRT